MLRLDWWMGFLMGMAASLCLGQTIDTVAGNGKPENNGDMGPATARGVKDPFGVEFGPDGALYITEVGHHRIRRVHGGRISTVAGTGAKGYSGDGGPARQATLNEPYEVRLDKQGNMLFVEMQNHLIRMVDARSGTIATLAGTGEAGYGGDGGPARRAQFRRPHSLALDAAGNVYVADIGNHRVRRIDRARGTVSTIAGNGEAQLPVSGERAAGRPLRGPRALAITGNTLWIALREGNSVWQLDLDTGVLSHIAGSGQKGQRDGAADEATFKGPKGIVVDAENNAFVVDTENHVIRRIDGKTRRVTTIAGSGARGGGGDGGPALRAAMDRPHGICIGPKGTLVIGDTLNHRVRAIPGAAAVAGKRD